MTSKIESLTERKLNRRGFIAGAGTFLGGAALMAAGHSISEANTQSKPIWPAPYTILDPEDIRVRGYLGYYKGA